MGEPKQGEVWWADIPEPTGRRPVLILTRNEVIPLRDNVTVAPLTTTIRGIASEVELGPEHGMPARCAASLDNLVAIPRFDLDVRITTLDTDSMNAVFEAIHFALGLPY